jgi:hypothetical protein
MTESEERESELAELLAEVRALRRDLEQLRGTDNTVGGPSYAVLARSESARDPDYNVLVRQLGPQEGSGPGTPRFREPSYEVLVRQDLPEPGDLVE